MTQIPSVKVPEAIAPSNFATGEDVLEYEKLQHDVEFYKASNADRQAIFLDSKEGSVSEETYGFQLALEYFLRTALKVVQSNEDNVDIWSDRFTQATIELYGEPDIEEATRLLSEERDFVLSLRGIQGISSEHVDFLLNIYESVPIIDSATKEASGNLVESKIAIQKYRDAILEKYGPMFDIVDASGKDEFGVSDLLALFNDSLIWLEANDDSDWGQWSVIEVEEGSLSVDSFSKTIKIPSHREPVNAQTAKGLVAHELLVHALRAKNGYKTGDNKLATGLKGYLNNEEGLGILVEEAITGEFPDKAYDRFIDIALALGTVDGMQRSRKELFDISFARQLIRSQLKGEVSEEAKLSLERKVWGHIDRIYRGGPGDERGTRKAIYTKDIVYYVGYRQMIKYITEQISSGKTADEIFEYLSQAKFDPSDARHLELLVKAKQ